MFIVLLFVYHINWCDYTVSKIIFCFTTIFISEVKGSTSPTPAVPSLSFTFLGTYKLPYLLWV